MSIVFEQVSVDTIALNGHSMSVEEILVLEPVVGIAMCRTLGSCQKLWDDDELCLKPLACNTLGQVVCERGHVDGNPLNRAQINVLLAGTDWNQILDQHKLDALVIRLQAVRQQAVGQQAVGQQAVGQQAIVRDPHVLGNLLQQQLQNHGGGLANGGHQ